MSFCFVFRIGTALCHRRNEDGNVLWSIGKNNAKSMTVTNGGNAIEGRRSVGFVRLGLAKAVFFLCVGRAVVYNYSLFKTFTINNIFVNFFNIWRKFSYNFVFILFRVDIFFYNSFDSVYNKIPRFIFVFKFLNLFLCEW